jgi:hypothetical protein
MAEHQPAQHKAAAGGMTKKMGPLPVWAWGLIIGVGVYFLYERYSSGSSSTSSTAASAALDPNAIDPNTGLTYGAEESAAENANAATATSPASGSLDSSGGTADTSMSSELADFGTFLGIMQQIDPTFGAAGATGATGATGAGADTTGTGASNQPMTGSTPPPTTPTVNAQLASPVPGIQAPVTTPLVITAGPAAGLTKGIGATIKVVAPTVGVGTVVKKATTTVKKTVKNGIVTG